MSQTPEQILAMIQKLPKDKKIQLISDIFEGKQIKDPIRRGTEVFSVQLFERQFRVIQGTVSENKDGALTIKVISAPENFERKTLVFQESEIFTSKEDVEEALFAGLTDLEPKRTRERVEAKTKVTQPTAPAPVAAKQAPAKVADDFQRERKQRGKMDLYPKGDQYVKFMDFLALYDITPGDYTNGTPASELTAHFMQSGVGNANHWRSMVALLRQKFKIDSITDENRKIVYPMRLKDPTKRVEPIPTVAPGITVVRRPNPNAVPSAQGNAVHSIVPKPAERSLFEETL